LGTKLTFLRLNYQKTILEIQSFPAIGFD
jgi:hypothetical protein